MSLTVDDCKDAVIPDPDSTEVRRDNCQSSQAISGENRFLNVETLLELGGRALQGSWWPTSVETRQSYDGCVKNLNHNGQVVPTDVVSVNVILSI